MKLLMHVLRDNKKLKIDNSKLRLDKAFKLLDEETKEVKVAVETYSRSKSLLNLIEVIAETFDVIQICILILSIAKREGKEQFGCDKIIEDINIQHKDKLSSRGWNIETGIKIEVIE